MHGRAQAKRYFVELWHQQLAQRVIDGNSIGWTWRVVGDRHRLRVLERRRHCLELFSNTLHTKSNNVETVLNAYAVRRLPRVARHAIKEHWDQPVRVWVASMSGDRVREFFAEIVRG